MCADKIFPCLQDRGKPSVIKTYCEKVIATRGKESECIWICIKKGRRLIARDVQLSERPLGVYELRRLCGWWKRHSLFSAVGVREVKMRFLAINPLTREIEVVLKDFGHIAVQVDLDRHIAAALQAEGRTHSFECEVDIMGVRHAADAPAGEGSYRRIQRSHDLKRLKEESGWLPAMLEYYWRNGIGEKGVQFLESTEFVRKYSDLTYDTYEDAANLYGKSINAFALVEGWRIQYLLCLVLASLLLSICVVATATAITKSFEAGLTTGSYALGLATIILAVLTFLSAVV